MLTRRREEKLNPKTLNKMKEKTNTNSDTVDNLGDHSGLGLRHRVRCVARKRYSLKPCKINDGREDTEDGVRLSCR